MTHSKHLSRSLLMMAAITVRLALASSDTFASEPRPRTNQSGYHLFHPAPREQLRKLWPDRPTKTEGAFTVDAGHFQIETDLGSYFRDQDSSSGLKEEFYLNRMNFKAGVSHRVDAELLIESFIWSDFRASDSSREQHRGFGDLTLRIKVNLEGNDSGDYGIGIMPFIKIPTNSGGLANKKFEGGLIFPFEFPLPHDFHGGLTLAYQDYTNEIGEGYHHEGVLAFSASRELLHDLNAFAEFYGKVSSETDSTWIGTLDFALTYDFADDLQIDTGVFLGVTEAADDFNPFLGMTIRL